MYSTIELPWDGASSGIEPECLGLPTMALGFEPIQAL